MVKYVTRFREKLSEDGFILTLFYTLRYIKNNVKGTWRTWRYEFVRSKLLVASPPTFPHALYVKLYRQFLERKIGSGIEIMEEDWDNLIILDAYRADYFAEYSSLKGELSTVVSKGSWSYEFIVGNFQRKEFHDTVVVSANPMYQMHHGLDESTFHKLILLEEGAQVSNPAALTERAHEAIEEFPNKRIILHYMPPHEPHLGETATRLRDAFESIDNEEFPGMFSLYRDNHISQETLKQSYIENIEIIEDEIQEVLEVLDGKTVVTADHGENLGETRHGMRQVHHGNETPECRLVPWLEMDYDERKEIIEETPTEFETVDQTVAKERLNALGYK